MLREEAERRERMYVKKKGVNKDENRDDGAEDGAGECERFQDVVVRMGHRIQNET